MSRYVGRRQTAEGIQNDTRRRSPSSPKTLKSTWSRISKTSPLLFNTTKVSLCVVSCVRAGWPNLNLSGWNALLVNYWWKRQLVSNTNTIKRLFLLSIDIAQCWWLSHSIKKCVWVSRPFVWWSIKKNKTLLEESLVFIVNEQDVSRSRVKPVLIIKWAAVNSKQIKTQLNVLPQ